MTVLGYIFIGVGLAYLYRAHRARVYPKRLTMTKIMMESQEWQRRYNGRTERLKRMIEQQAPPAIIEMYCRSVLITIADSRGREWKAIASWIDDRLKSKADGIGFEARLLYWRLRGYERECAADIVFIGDDPKDHKRPFCDCNAEIKVARAMMDEGKFI